MAPRAWKLALFPVAVLALVVAEIAAIIWVAGEIGWWTILVLLATTVLGLYLLQREWRKSWGHLAEAARSGHLPPGRLADTTLVLLGGILLVLPGFISDAVGLLLILPFTRPFVRSAITWWASRTLQKSGAAPVVIKGDVEETETLIPAIERDDEVVEGTVVDESADDGPREPQ